MNKDHHKNFCVHRNNIMIRREARLRREYLYRKSVEEQERVLYEKKHALKKALENGTPIPRELKEESQSLSKDLVFDPNIMEPSTHADDEYAMATLKDPKIVITTSRDPSSRLMQFTKEVRLMFPNSQRLNRGGYVISQLVQTCKDNDVTDMIILHEHRGVPTGMIVSHLPYGPTAYFSLHNVVLRHDLDEKERHPVSEAYPHLIFENLTSKLGKRIQSILTHLFPIPKPDSKRVMTFSNEGNYISFRHHTFVKNRLSKTVDLTEIGPRFELRPYHIKLGTVDIQEADTEWALRPFMNSSKRKDVLMD